MVKNKRLETISLGKVSMFRTTHSKNWQLRAKAPDGKYHVRSSGSADRFAAMSIAKEYLAHLATLQTVADVQFQFRTYADLLPKTSVDDWKNLNRSANGILSWFGNKDVREVTTKALREYTNHLNAGRKKPYAVSYVKKQLGTIRKVLRFALESNIITALPEAPKLDKMTTNPRPSFEEDEYKLLLAELRRYADGGLMYKASLVTREFYDMTNWLYFTMLRPTERELMGMRVRDCQVVNTPQRHVRMNVQGKTGARTSHSLPPAADIFERQVDRYGLQPDDYLWMPEYTGNRQYPLRKYAKIFKKVLTTANLLNDANGDIRTLYSLRHMSLKTRLRVSGGKTNLLTLAKNAGTSPAMLELYYLKNISMNDELIENLHYIEKKRRVIVDLGELEHP